MKSLLMQAILGLACCLALTSAGRAQPSDDTLTDVRDEKMPAVPVADAKQRLREAQKHLDELSKGGALNENRLEPLNAKFDIAVVQKPRDQLRAAVAEAFDARRQLQQSELAELERRIANIKRAMQINDAMRETIIDQRTDELLDQLEERGRSGGREGSANPGGGRPRHPGGKNGAAIEPADVSPYAERATTDDKAAEARHRLAELDVQEAEANLTAAEVAYERFKRFYESRAIEKSLLDEQAEKHKRAKIQLERAKTNLKALGGAATGGDSTSDSAPGQSNAAETEDKLRLAAVDLKEAEENLAAAERDFERTRARFQTGVISQDEYHAAEHKFNLAKIAVERANVKLRAFDALPREGQPTESSSDTGVVDQLHDQIAWGLATESAQLGYKIEPRKEVYQLGDVVTVTLLIRNAGDQPLELTIPRTQILEKLKLDLVLHEGAEGQKLAWRWGPAHQEPQEVSGAFGFALQPGQTHLLPPFMVSLGEADVAGSGSSLMAVLSGAKSGKSARLAFKLSKSYDAGQAAELQSAPFEFRVEEAGVRR